MTDKKDKVTIDVAASLALDIQAEAAKCGDKYNLNAEVYNSLLTVYQKFRKLASLNDGGIKSVDFNPANEVVKITAEVPDVDLFREGLDLFSDLLAKVDSFDVSADKSGYLIIEVGVAGLWKAV